MAREINLVPDIKGEMIKALKIRNLTFFICIVVGLASIATIVVFAVIAGSQRTVVNGKKGTLEALSSKIVNYNDLSKYLTVKDQLGNLSTISENKKLLSRTFGVLSALLPTSGDTITISELSIDLGSDTPTISFDAQANANLPPYIDYNVLDSFKKSMQYMRYDYGNYVDKNGDAIPAYCIIENGSNGAKLSDPDKGYYAYWLINGEGCNPAYSESLENLQSGEDDSSSRAAARDTNYATESYNGQTVVRIWRTPQFNEWYASSNMTLDGTITGIAHFDSQCTTYTGALSGTSSVPAWTTSNDSCTLVPDGVDGIKISDSSNGRGSGNELVLRFSAIISINPEVFSFKNNHVLAVGPSGRVNVTDSFVQIQNMFEERAADCEDGDTACINQNGGN